MQTPIGPLTPISVGWQIRELRSMRRRIIKKICAIGLGSLALGALVLFFFFLMACRFAHEVHFQRAPYSDIEAIFRPPIH
jgi:hypothetical protein